MITRARRLAADAVVNVEIGLVMAFLAMAGLHAWLKGRAQ